jgi:hypothetical protein
MRGGISQTPRMQQGKIKINTALACLQILVGTCQHETKNLTEKYSFYDEISFDE